MVEEKGRCSIKGKKETRVHIIMLVVDCDDSMYSDDLVWSKQIVPFQSGYLIAVERYF